MWLGVVLSPHTLLTLPTARQPRTYCPAYYHMPTQSRSLDKDGNSTEKDMLLVAPYLHSATEICHGGVEIPSCQQVHSVIP